MPASSAPHRRSPRILLVYALAYAGGVIGYLPLLTLLLPIKVEAVAGEARLGVLTATVIAGAIAASGSNVLWGWCSDRSVARGRGRRRWLAGGVAATAAAYAVLAAAATPGAIIAAIMLFQVAINAVLAPLIALIADEVPDAQKGVMSALFAFANPVAAAMSAGLLAVPGLGNGGLGEAGRLLLVPLAAGICLAPLLMLRARPLPLAQAPARASPGRDLLVAAAARLLVQIAGNVLFLYMLYYFESVAPGVPRSRLAIQAGHLLTLSYLLPLPVALIAGRWSDRSGRRRPALVAAALVAAGGLAGMAMARGTAAGAVGFMIYAVGWAVFLALHAGFAMELLPSARHRGRDLGLFNLSNTLPALAGPLLTWWLASPASFAVLLGVLAAVTLAGGLLMLATSD